MLHHYFPIEILNLKVFLSCYFWDQLYHQFGNILQFLHLSWMVKIETKIAGLLIYQYYKSKVNNYQMFSYFMQIILINI